MLALLWMQASAQFSDVAKKSLLSENTYDIITPAGPKTLPKKVEKNSFGRPWISQTPRQEQKIEPEEPEPPPAHSIGRVGEDAMGRSGQFVKPCWLVAGGVALVVRSWWPGWWLGLFFHFFLTCFVVLSMKNYVKSQKVPNQRKKSKNDKKKRPKTIKVFFARGA